jgi:hypothetical protein
MAQLPANRVAARLSGLAAGQFQFWTAWGYRRIGSANGIRWRLGARPGQMSPSTLCIRELDDSRANGVPTYNLSREACHHQILLCENQAGAGQPRANRWHMRKCTHNPPCLYPINMGVAEREFFDLQLVHRSARTILEQYVPPTV